MNCLQEVLSSFQKFSDSVVAVVDPVFQPVRSEPQQIPNQCSSTDKIPCKRDIPHDGNTTCVSLVHNRDLVAPLRRNEQDFFFIKGKLKFFGHGFRCAGLFSEIGVVDVHLAYPRLHMRKKWKWVKVLVAFAWKQGDFFTAVKLAQCAVSFITVQRLSMSFRTEPQVTINIFPHSPGQATSSA